jgi:hypothetical protein
MAKMTKLEMTINQFNAAGQQSYILRIKNIHVTIFNVGSRWSKENIFNKRSKKYEATL